MWLAEQGEQILPVAALDDRLRQRFQLLCGDETLAICDLFRAGNAQTLAPFNRVYKEAGLEEGLVRARIEPGHAAAHDLNIQGTRFQIKPV